MASAKVVMLATHCLFFLFFILVTNETLALARGFLIFCSQNYSQTTKKLLACSESFKTDCALILAEFPQPAANDFLS